MGHSRRAGTRGPSLHARGGVARLFFRHEQGHVEAVVYTQSADRYTLEHLPAGTYAIKSGYDRRGDPAFTFTLADGETKTLDLDERVYPISLTAEGARGLLRIAVLGEDGIVLPGTDVYLTRDGTRLDPSYDTERVVLFAGRAGDYTLHAVYPGYRPLMRSVRLESQPPTGRSLIGPDMIIELSRN